MEKETNLKSKNVPQLWVFLSANILFVCGIFFLEYTKILTKDFDVSTILRFIGVSIAPLILFLLNGLISSHQKAVLVFWKLKHPLPGSEAFSRISKDDSRIDILKLKEIYGSLPESPADQNKLWYKIYKKNISNTIVLESHKGFLLARDLTSLSFLFLIFIGSIVLIIGEWPLNFYYFIGLILQFLIVAIGAQNRGNRFVANVLAIESCN